MGGILMASPGPITVFGYLAKTMGLSGISAPGSGLPPYSMNSIMSSWASGLISSPSKDPTRGSPPPTEYVTSFKSSPLSRIRDATLLRILAGTLPQDADEEALGR